MPTANLSEFSGTRDNGRCTIKSTKATARHAATAPALAATSIPRPVPSAITMNTTSSPSRRTALKVVSAAISRKERSQALARPFSASRLDCFVAAPLAMLSVRPARPFSARSEARDDKIDHLVDRWARLGGTLRDHLWMEKPDHRGAGTPRRERHVRGLEFA